MNARLKCALAGLALAAAGHATAQVTFYERESFQGRSFTTDRDVGNFGRFGFNDRASSAVVQGERWQACEDVRFGGRCMILRPGQYPSLSAMGLGDRVSSVRVVERDGPIPDPRDPPAPGPAQVTFYEHDNFQGRSFTTDRAVGNFARFGFNDRASSVVVQGERWEACEDARFGGRCMILRPGPYPSLSAMRLGDRITSVRTVARDERVDDNRYAPTPVESQIIFYERNGFEGRSLTVGDSLDDLGRSGFNDRASSVMVLGERWQICEDVRFQGRCVVLRPGRYASLAEMGLSDRVSSAQVANRDVRVDDSRHAPVPVAVYDSRRRHDERVYEATITSVRAVVGTAEQRCWVERERVVQNNRNTNVGGALAGALIGGILGHQVGGGTGKDIATVGGAVVGAVVGSSVGRDAQGRTAYDQDVQRCSSVSGPVSPAYWDVSYDFGGQEHRVQMSTQPGPTITVNQRGEPRA